MSILCIMRLSDSNNDHNSFFQDAAPPPQNAELDKGTKVVCTFSLFRYIDEAKWHKSTSQTTGCLKHVDNL